MLYITLFYNWKICTFWLQHLFCPPPTPILVVTIILFWVLFSFICYLFIILEFTCKWNHIVFVFLCLTYFTYHETMKVCYVITKGKISFIFCGWVVFLCVYIPHILWASLVAQLVKNSRAIQETLVWFLGNKISWRRDRLLTPVFLSFSGGSDGKESVCNVGDLC